MLVLSESSTGERFELRSTRPIAIGISPLPTTQVVPSNSSSVSPLAAQVSEDYVTADVNPSWAGPKIVPQNEALEAPGGPLPARSSDAPIIGGTVTFATGADIVPSQPPNDRHFANRRPITASGYVFVRASGDRAGLSGNPTLGGSQMAVFVDGPIIAQRGRTAFRPFARVTAAGQQLSPQDLAIGLSAEARWGRLVSRAAIERRVALADDSRNALAARATLGLYKPILQTPMTVSAYGQAGLVGLNRRDGFIEGEVRLALSEGDAFRRLKPGIGSWGAKQPGASRLDIGPTLDIPVAQARPGVTIRADWRFRVSGNAKPASGPSLTIATAF